MIIGIFSRGKNACNGNKLNKKQIILTPEKWTMWEPSFSENADLGAGVLRDFVAENSF